MGGTVCKIIIDNGNGLTRVMQCMNASILLAAAAGEGHVDIPLELQSEFLKLSEQLAQACAKIEKKASEQSAYGGAADKGQKS